MMGVDEFIAAWDQFVQSWLQAGGATSVAAQKLVEQALATGLPPAPVPATESSDDPDDEQVDVPEDVALPWPDAARIAPWWSAQQGRFEAGRRYFLGKPVTPAHCRDVLATGFQRQRIAAALFLPILAPGSVLFNCSAPAWRQTRLFGGASS